MLRSRCRDGLNDVRASAADPNAPWAPTVVRLCDDILLEKMQARSVTGGNEGRGRLVLWSSLYGIWLGIATDVLFDIDGDRALILAPLLGMGAGLGLSLAATSSYQVTVGEAWTIITGLDYGSFNGALWAGGLDFSSKAIVGSAVATGIAAASIGVLVADAKSPSAGDIEVVRSSLLWGTVGGFLLTFVVAPDVSSESGLKAVAAAMDAGLLVGVGLANSFDLSRNRVLIIDAGAIAGGLATAGIAWLVAGSDNNVRGLAGRRAGRHAGRHRRRRVRDAQPRRAGRGQRRRPVRARRAGARRRRPLEPGHARAGPGFRRPRLAPDRRDVQRRGRSVLKLPLSPPIEPMLAKLTSDVPEGDGWLYEPKWDGFRALVFRDGDEIYVQSRDSKPMGRYFPELEAPLRAALPARAVLDGEIVIAGASGLDFSSLLLRVHPAASRVAMLAREIPASFVAWDLLAEGDEDLMSQPLVERRRRLEAALAGAQPPIHLTPATRDRKLALEWFERFEGAGLDGVIAKRLDQPYQPGQRSMIKVKHARTADCVVAGFRWHKQGPGTMLGSLLLGLYDNEGKLHHVGIAASFTVKRRKELVEELAPLRENALDGHPWREWAAFADPDGAEPDRRMPGATSRWNRGKDLSWEPLRIERVCEVGYDHLQGDRFRHATHFVRWRPDKQPADCRYDQLEERPAAELAHLFGSGSTG